MKDNRPVTPPARIVRFSPELATEILDTQNTMNRNVRQSRVDKYASDMQAGRWMLNGETIKFSKDGDLLDGQHRLWAVVMAGVPVEMMVVDGIDPEAFHTIDTGAPRSFADVARIGGNVNVTALAATIKMLWWYDNTSRDVRKNGTSATHSELSQMLEDNPDVIDRVAEVQNVKRARGIITPAALTLVYTLAYRQDPAKAGQWLNHIESGAGLDERHPCYLLRERMIANKGATAKLPVEDVAALCAKSWNLFVEGKRPAVLRWMKSESFPVIGPAKKSRRR